jgi:ribosome recycling factor
MKEIEKLLKEGQMSEDEKFAKKEDTQKKVDAANRTLDGLYEKKEAEINK